MEILYYFSFGLKPPDKTKWSYEQIENEKKSFNYPDDYKWAFELRKILCSHLEFFIQLKNHSNEDVVDYTEMILENIHPYCE
ncbi:hypothetical protein J8281_05590 [Aquimarina sp. U1-2]|uniref:hypothetical protein n=1 Tax=Aquimarina sp. U1-2 TaxID=2823141 RepID=UPI001AECB8EA|nr:hypothetical protein [Aquimarina sp. U1-2]MBP2831657.1 hypothetical protein [Aquimarina sp. U1-2]